MRLSGLTRVLVAVTLLASVGLAAGGFVLGRTLGEQDAITSVPVTAVTVPADGDPIVPPSRMEIPR